MKTINKILKESGYTKEFLLECRKSGRTNWMGGKWGIQWTEKMRKMQFFENEREQELLDDLDLVSDMHDIAFENETGTNILKSILNFIKANYDLILRIIRLLHWTSIYSRIWFLLWNITLTVFWVRYFNWNLK